MDTPHNPSLFIDAGYYQNQFVGEKVELYVPSDEDIELLLAGDVILAHYNFPASQSEVLDTSALSHRISPEGHHIFEGQVACNLTPTAAANEYLTDAALCRALKDVAAKVLLDNHPALTERSAQTTQQGMTLISENLPELTITIDVQRTPLGIRSGVFEIGLTIDDAYDAEEMTAALRDIAGAWGLCHDIALSLPVVSVASSREAKAQPLNLIVGETNSPTFSHCEIELFGALAHLRSYYEGDNYTRFPELGSISTVKIVELERRMRALFDSDEQFIAELSGLMGTLVHDRFLRQRGSEQTITITTDDIAPIIDALTQC